MKRIWCEEQRESWSTYPYYQKRRLHMIYHDCKQPVQTDVSRSESDSLVTEHICGEVAGDVVERSRCEERDVGVQ